MNKLKKFSKSPIFHLILIVVIMAVIAHFMAYNISKDVEEMGGAKQIIINIGKDIKDIADEIKKP